MDNKAKDLAKAKTDLDGKAVSAEKLLAENAKLKLENDSLEAQVNEPHDTDDTDEKAEETESV